ncbi:PQQ-dependent sugar dehydrogenase [Autumnicola musiva]|uniref:PQQ-dependent sugar dehydrogenase n=1 Tax=Autumnicola musiva TaxID=3075589 RepID=A0ABU3DB61_9FLAO|nr:PQQ-dependent sugar dehydrogenase [Zunongwangia sp. F117]MDT0678604.1 PQQ-dependent sugar dehydrogenase [Zunongwangia sp. F117]
MHRIFIAFLIFVTGNVLAQVHTKDFKRRIVIQDLDDPWEVTFGPDSNLWVTESKSYLVKKINPETGKSTLLLDLSNERKFARFDTLKEPKAPWPQGGLMGLALHPEFQHNKKFVYLCYVAHLNSVNSLGGAKYTGKLVRYQYNSQSEKLENPMVICDTLPQSNDHNSGRLAVGKLAGKYFLYLTVGDGGAGQYSNAGQPNYAQDKEHYSGKVLRFHLEPDNDAGDYNRWIPNDNPFNEQEKQNAVWTYGHRNAQGIAFAEIGRKEFLYASEHGPYGDDELNLIIKGKNYGHPNIIGYNDNNYNSFAGAVSDNKNLPLPWHTTLPTINEERSAAQFGDTFQEPEKVFKVISAEMLETVFSKSFKDAPYVPETSALAPSSLAIYTADAIPGWQNSLLIPSLKEGKLVRLQIGTDLKVEKEETNYFEAEVRYRDVAISTDGKKIYLSTDNSKASSGPSKENPQDTNCTGCIIEYKYEGNQ